MFTHPLRRFLFNYCHIFAIKFICYWPLSAVSPFVKYSQYHCLIRDSLFIIHMYIISGFPTTCKFSNKMIDCKMNENKCLKHWNRNHWRLTHSASTHMSPVFDQRWEGKSSAVWKRNAIFAKYNYDGLIKPFRATDKQQDKKVE